MPVHYIYAAVFGCFILFQGYPIFQIPRRTLRSAVRPDRYNSSFYILKHVYFTTTNAPSPASSVKVKLSAIMPFVIPL